MIADSLADWTVLVSTSLILACVITLSQIARSILENFVSSMEIVDWPCVRRLVRNYVSIVDHSEVVWEFRIRKCSIGIIAYSRLSEVYHRCFKPNFYKLHRNKMSHGATQTVSGCLD